MRGEIWRYGGIRLFYCGSTNNFNIQHRQAQIKTGGKKKKGRRKNVTRLCVTVCLSCSAYAYVPEHMLLDLLSPVKYECFWCLKLSVTCGHQQLNCPVSPSCLFSNIPWSTGAFWVRKNKPFRRYLDI